MFKLDLDIMSAVQWKNSHFLVDKKVQEFMVLSWDFAHNGFTQGFPLGTEGPTGFRIVAQVEAQGDPGERQRRPM